MSGTTRLAVGIIGTTILLGLPGSLLAADKPAGKFVNITTESGVAAVVEAHYRAVPDFWLSGVTLVDFDGDGKLDLHIGGHGFPCVAAAGNGKGHFTLVDRRPEIPRGKGKKEVIPYGGGEIRLMFDLLERGRQDMLSSYGDAGGATYLNESAPGNPPAWSFRPYDAGLDAFSRAAAFADLNRDGLVDYMETGDGGRANATHPLNVSYGKGEGKWETAPLGIRVLKESGAIPVDINGDGLLDLLTTQRGYNPPGRRLLLQEAAPTSAPAGGIGFRDATKECGLDGSVGSIHGVGDVNQDGYPDLICIEPPKVVIYLNDGRGHFTPGAEIAGMEKVARREIACTWGGAVVVDLDNDAIPDVLVNGKTYLYVLRGLGGGKFEFANDAWGLPSAVAMTMEAGLCFGDIDGDGMMDFVTGGPGPTEKLRGVAVYRNELSPKHWLNIQLIGAKGNRAATSARISVYEGGGLGDPQKLLHFEPVTVWGRESFQSYYFAKNTERHFGLGERTSADVRVEFYPSGKKMEARGLKANSTIEIKE